MKKILLLAAIAAIMAACGKKKCECQCQCQCAECSCAGDTAKKASDLNFKIINSPEVELAEPDKDGYITLFDGKTLTGWRGYGKETVPSRWTASEGAIHFTGSGLGEAQESEGGDLIFAHKFQNFELELEYKISKGGNSGIFYLAQEVSVEKRGKTEMLPIWQSCAEYQVLDNENHEDAKLGVDGNRKSGSLYDMIPAVPQNAKPFGEWNTAKITVSKGTVVHYQNGEKVLEYHLWTPKWDDMLQASKFREGGEFPVAYPLMKDMGKGEGMNGGYIGLQDHGDDVWYRNVRVKQL